MGKRNRTHSTRRAARATTAPPARIDALEPRRLLTTLPSGFGETVVAENILSPTAMAFAPDGRLFVAEKGGALRVIKDGQLLPTPFTTVAASTFSERGLGGIAIDPHFEQNGYVYLYYTAETPAAHNRLSRFTADGDVALPGSEQVLLDLPDAGNGTIHNGGAMKFLPDGTLLIGVGDHQVPANAQDMNTPFGKVLRINPDGSIPADNPFANSATGVSRAIWALGLRNPFTMDVQPGTGRVFINDVGQANWEEINQGAAGANYGWVTTEGPFDPALHPAFTNPFHAYDHAEGQAVTGGAFYNPPVVQFPAENVGHYFFADFGAGFIRRLNPETKQVAPFATDAFGVVDLDVAPDGSLYWLSRFTDSVYRISATLAPQVASHPQSQLVSLGQPVTFAVGATGADLSYQWQRDGVDIPGATAASYTIPSVALADSGAQFRCVIANPQGSTQSNAATLTVTADQPPTPVILTPAAGATYRGGTTVSYSGAASDDEDGDLPGAAMTWWVDFHHADHVHPFLPPATGAAAGAFDIPALDHGAADVFYRVHLSVTDSAGFTRTTHRDLHPQLATITVRANHPGLQLAIDGQPRATPIVMTGVVGTQRTLAAAPAQVVDGLSYAFDGWSNGGAATQAILIPEADTTYTASYHAHTDYWLSDRPFAASAGTEPARDRNQWGSPITLDGVQYPRGLGVVAGADVSFDLGGGGGGGGAFERFRATVGRDDTYGDLGSMAFQVWVDGVKRFDSGVMTGATPAKLVDVDVTGASVLRLVATDGGDVPNYDLGNWAAARLVHLGHVAPDAPADLAAAAPRYNRVHLTWRDVSSNEAAFLIERSSDGVTFAQVGSVAAGVTSYVDAYRDGGATYHYRVRGRNGVGTSPYGATAAATTPPGTLAAPWREADLGEIAPAYAGSADHDTAAGQIAVHSAGYAIGAEADAAHFVYQPLAGDGVITARLAGWGGYEDNASVAALMVRESLDPAARSVALALTHGPYVGAEFLRRPTPGGNTLIDPQGYYPAPRWVRLARSGDTFTAWTSADGASWFPFGGGDVAMSASVYIGLAVSSHNSFAQTTAYFDNITVTNPPPTLVHPAAATPDPVTGTTAALSALGDDAGGESNLTYTWSAASVPDGAPAPTFAANGTNAAKNTTVTFGRAGAYELRVRISDGAQFIDSAVTVTVQRALTSLVITPQDPPPLAPGATLDLVAGAFDQFGDAFPDPPPLAWSVTGDGSITADGRYTAGPTAGTYVVTATAGDVTASVEVVVAADEPFAQLDAAGTLVVTGTGGADAIALGLVGGEVVATLNGASLAFDPATVAKIEIRGGAGDDDVDVSHVAQTLNYTAAAGGGRDSIRALAGTLALGDDFGPAADVAVSVADGAALRFTGPQHLASLALLGDATATFGGAGATGAAANFVVVLETLALSDTSALDLGGGALVVHDMSVGAWHAGAGYDGAMRHVASAYREAAWDGPGITSRFAAAAGGLTGVAVARAADVLGIADDAAGAWRGATVTGDSVLLAYTYAGDTNFDGKLDADDYGTIDFAVLVPGSAGYHAGDFNFDGKVDADDYGVIDFNILAQDDPIVP